MEEADGKCEEQDCIFSGGWCTAARVRCVVFLQLSSLLPFVFIFANLSLNSLPPSLPFLSLFFPTTHRFLKLKRNEMGELRKALFPMEREEDESGKVKNEKLSKAALAALKKSNSKYRGKPVMNWTPPDAAPLEAAQEWADTIADVKTQIANYQTGGKALRKWLRGHRNKLELMRERLFAKFA